MKFALIAGFTFLYTSLVIAAEPPQDDNALDSSNCARIDQLWQQDGKVGIGPLYLGMSASEAEQSGHLLYDKTASNRCAAYSARFMQDDGIIFVMLDSNRQIISLGTAAGDEQCDVKSQAEQARAIFPQIHYLPSADPMATSEATDAAPHYRIGDEPGIAQLWLKNNAIQLDNGQCSN